MLDHYENYIGTSISTQVYLLVYSYLWPRSLWTNNYRNMHELMHLKTFICAICYEKGMPINFF